MMLVPLKMESVFTRIPVANGILIAFISLVSIFSLIGVFPINDVEEYVLRDWDLGQMIGCTFLHANLIHLVGNMLFLWIFGNAICSAVGNATYPLIYLILGFFASASQLLYSEVQSIGASGAIFGVVGMTLVLFPTNRIRCWYCFSMPIMGILWKSGRFEAKAYWIILFFLIFENILPALKGGGSVGYGAHLGGFAAGIVFGVCLLLFKAVETYDPTLGELLTGERKERDTYDIDELHEIDARKAKIAARDAAMAPPRDDAFRAKIEADPALAAMYDYKADPRPVVRVLNILSKGALTTIFFVNDGDSISEIEVQSATATLVEFHPTHALGKGSTGWMKLQGFDQAQLPGLKFSLSYDIGTGYRLAREFSYDVSQKKFLTP
jgi:membrane associated rhomboid family serine protease